MAKSKTIDGHLVNGQSSDVYLDSTFAAARFTPGNGQNTYTAIAQANTSRLSTNSVTVKVVGNASSPMVRKQVSPFDLPAGTKLHFTLQRNGTNFETVATLRDILKLGNGE